MPLSSRIIASVVSIALVAGVSFPIPQSRAETVDDLQASIRERQRRIEELKKQTEQYEKSLAEKRKQSVSLSNELSIISDRIEKTRLEITTTETNIESITLEIRELEDSIRERGIEIDDRKEQLAALVRWQARTQERSVIRVLFSHDSFADFYDEMKSLQTVQGNISRLVKDVEAVKHRQENSKTILEQKRKALTDEVEALSNRRLEFESQQEAKAVLLQQTKSSEREFEALLRAAKAEQQKTNAEISSLEREVREKLKNQGFNGEAPTLQWPVPSRYVTARFHDPDYPFRSAFQHSGMDIRAAQGTTIKAAAAGYVARVRTGNPKDYWYVMIVHPGGLTTVYGHISQPLVKQDTYVTQGQPIALSGGTPGKPGSGPFVTGAHLHLEVRLNGTPVDPMRYF